MKIISLNVGAFGRLSNKKVEFSEGLNRIVGENGSGKSTLAAFIKAMLYGLSDSRKTSLLENERKRYLPWDGSGFGGSMVFSQGSKTYRVERSFGQRASEDVFALYDTATGRSCSDFSENLGEELFGIDSRGFEETLFFSEKNLSVSSGNGSVSAKLGGLSDCEGDMGALGKALERLDEQRRRYSKRGGGSISDKSAEITDAQRRLCELKARASELSTERQRLSSAKELRRRATEKIKALSEEKEAALLGKRSPSVAKKADTSIKKSDKKALFPIIILLICALTVSGLLLGALVHVYLYLLAVAGAFLALLLPALGRKEKGKSECTDEQIKAETERINGSIKEWESELSRAEREIALSERELEELSRTEEEIALVNDSLTGLSDRLSQDEQQLRIINLTKELLLKAKEAMDSKYLDLIREDFKKYCGKIDEHNEVRADVDTSFCVSCEENGITRPAEGYSRGTRELYSLAARLAVADSLYGEGRVPVILDDPFMSFDDKKTARALKLLNELAKERQIIYFTCSRAR